MGLAWNQPLPLVHLVRIWGKGDFSPKGWSQLRGGGKKTQPTKPKPFLFPFKPQLLAGWVADDGIEGGAFPMQVLSRCSSRTGMASGAGLCPRGLVRRRGQGTWNPSEIPNPPWLLPTEQGLDLCCPHRFVKCPSTPLTPPCRWATLVLLNKAAISRLLEPGGLSSQLFWVLVWFFLLLSSCFCSGTPERFIETSKGLRVEGMDVLSWPLAPGFVRLVFITAGEVTAMLRSNSKVNSEIASRLTSFKQLPSNLCSFPPTAPWRGEIN